MVALLSRNKYGQFVKVDPGTSDETLIDVKVNNPLHKIVELLQDLKRQKAFSFTLKGSVGIVGVSVLIVGTGMFGGSKLVCNKGLQTKIGVVRTLSITQTAQDHPLRARLAELVGSSYTPAVISAVILVDDSKNTIILAAKNPEVVQPFEGQEVLATGQFNGCTQELEVISNGIRPYTP